MKTCVSCSSCGFPLDETTSAAGVALYCRHCVDAEGRLRPYHEVLANNARWYEENQGLDPDAARRLATELMSKLPAWRDRVPS
jgi:hypothetical protein